MTEEPDMGLEPQVKKYFKKIINSFSVGLMWLLTVAIAGLGYRLAFIDGTIAWFNIAYYGLAIITFVLLIWFYYRLWK